MADLFLRIVGEDNTSSAFKDASTGVSKLAAELYRFGLDSVKQSEDQARADRLLESVAGGLTDTFKAQAAAMQSTLGVSDDMVQGIQTMLLRFGEAPASVEATTRALLDYAAATGTDAIAATKILTSAAQSGRAAFKELGLEYESTGVASKDLENITAALATKVGGAAAAEADSLTGSVNKAKQAFGELQEAIGQALTVMAGDAKGGSSWLVNTLDRLASNIRFLAGTTPETAASKLVILKESAASAFEALQEERVQLNKLYEMDAPVDAITRQMDFVKALEVAFLKAKKAREEFEAGGPKLSTEGSDRPTKAGAAAGDKQAKKPEESEEKEQEELLGIQAAYGRIEEAFREHGEAMAVERDQQAADLAKAHEDAAEVAEKEQKREQDAWTKRTEQHEERRQQELTVLARHMDSLAKEVERGAQKTEKEWEAAGYKIAGAFVDAMAEALSGAMEGGEVDVLGMVMDIGFAVAAIAAQVAVTAATESAAAGQLAAQGIGAAGRLASQARRQAWQAEQKGKKKHDGGWAGVPEYHGGGWPGLSSDEEAAVLQVGERVLSRGEVQRMGGPSGVDAAARGRGGTNVYVQTFDGSTTREFFENQGGRGFTNTMRTGRGQIPHLLRSFA